MPHDDVLSNYRMVREAMLSRAPVPAINIHPIPTEGVSPEIAASTYERELKSFYGADRLAPARPWSSSSIRISRPCAAASPPRSPCRRRRAPPSRSSTPRGARSSLAGRSSRFCRAARRPTPHMSSAPTGPTSRRRRRRAGRRRAAAARRCEPAGSAASSGRHAVVLWRCGGRGSNRVTKLLLRIILPDYAVASARI